VQWNTKTDGTAGKYIVYKESGPSEMPSDVLRPELNMLRPDEICISWDRHLTG